MNPKLYREDVTSHYIDRLEDLSRRGRLGVTLQDLYEGLRIRLMKENPLKNIDIAISYKEEATRAEMLERELRKEYWLNHNCPPDTLYGDDGEMQCQGPCDIADYKRHDLQDLMLRVWYNRTKMTHTSS